MTTKREAELELENLRLRIVLGRLARLGNGDNFGNSVGNCIAREALDFAPPTEALTELVEKVERLTIERCASAYAEETRTWRAWPQAGAAMRQGSKAIRALPTGTVKLEDLL